MQYFDVGYLRGLLQECQRAYAHVREDLNQNEEKRKIYLEKPGLIPDIDLPKSNTISDGTIAFAGVLVSLFLEILL